MQMPSMTSYPDEFGRLLAIAKQFAICLPQVRIRFHLVGACSYIDRVFAITVDCERQCRWSNGKYSQNGCDLGSIISRCSCFGNMAVNFETRSAFTDIPIYSISGGPEQ